MSLNFPGIAASQRLDALLPTDRTVAVDSGHFMGYPELYPRSWLNGSTRRFAAIEQARDINAGITQWCGMLGYLMRERER